MKVSERHIVATGKVFAAKIQDDSVVLNPTTGTYFGLNELATLLLEQMASPTSLGKLAEFVANRYDVTYDQCISDIVAFSTRLVEQGLATWVPECSES